MWKVRQILTFGTFESKRKAEEWASKEFPVNEDTKVYRGYEVVCANCLERDCKGCCGCGNMLKENEEVCSECK